MSALPNAAPAAASMAGALHVFMAGTSAGALGFSLPMRHPRPLSDGGRTTLDAALALSHAEPWLTQLEDWLGEGLVPNLSSATEPALAARLFTRHAVLREPASGAAIYLPLAALRALAAPPPRALGAWTWQTLPCDVLLDAAALSDSDIEALRPGALVIFPASFSSDWQARLRPVGGRGSLYGASLRESHGRLSVEATGPVAASLPHAHITFSLAHPIDFELHELMGWPGPPGTRAFGCSLDDTRIVLDAGSASSQPQPLATGTLMPLGSGYAARIDHLQQLPHSWT
jgi:hypothetical protein